MAEDLQSILTDDVNISTSFIHDLPPRGSQIEDGNLHSFVVIGQKALRMLTLNFFVRFTESKGFKINQMTFTKLTPQIIERSHKEFSERNQYLTKEILAWDDRWNDESAWVFDFVGYNSIFQMYLHYLIRTVIILFLNRKLIMNELLKKLHTLDSEVNLKKLTSLETLDMFYGVYYPKTYQNWKTDHKLIQELFVCNQATSVEKELVAAKGKFGTQPGYLLLRVRNDNNTFSFNKLFETLQKLKVRVTNICSLNKLDESMIESINTAFGFKHSKQALVNKNIVLSLKFNPTKGLILDDSSSKVYYCGF